VIRTSADLADHKSLNERRRPGYGALFDDLARSNPAWSYDKVARAAKQAWSNAHFQTGRK
jgi:hypothetical protein